MTHSWKDLPQYFLGDIFEAGQGVVWNIITTITLHSLHHLERQVWISASRYVLNCCKAIRDDEIRLHGAPNQVWSWCIRCILACWRVVLNEDVKRWTSTEIDGLTVNLGLQACGFLFLQSWDTKIETALQSYNFLWHKHRRKFRLVTTKWLTTSSGKAGDCNRKGAPQEIVPQFHISTQIVLKFARPWYLLFTELRQARQEYETALQGFVPSTMLC